MRSSWCLVGRAVFTLMRRRFFERACIRLTNHWRGAARTACSSLADFRHWLAFSIETKWSGGVLVFMACFLSAPQSLKFQVFEILGFQTTRRTLCMIRPPMISLLDGTAARRIRTALPKGPMNPYRRVATWTSTSARELRVIADASVGISSQVLRALSVSDQMIRILLRSQDLQREKEV